MENPKSLKIAKQIPKSPQISFLLQVEQTPYPLVILDREGCVLAANSHASDLVGCCEVSGLAGKSFREYIEDDCDSFPALLQNLMQDEASDLSCLLRLRSRGEETDEVEVKGRKVHYYRKPALFMTPRPLKK